METTVAVIVVIVSLVAALLLGRHQLKQIRWFKEHEFDLPPEDRTYYWWSIRRRLAGCLLLVVLAGMIWGLYGFGIADQLNELNALGDQNREKDSKLTPEQEAFVYNSMTYVGVLVLVLFVVFLLVMWDLQAIRQFGRRHRQRIRADRRAMLERQLPLLYAERRAQQDER